MVGHWLSAVAFDWAGMTVERVLPVVAITLAVAGVAEVLVSGCALAGYQFMATSGYLEASGGARPAHLSEATGDRAGGVASRAFAAVAAIAVIAAAVAWLVIAVAIAITWLPSRRWSVPAPAAPARIQAES